MPPTPAVLRLLALPLLLGHLAACRASEPGSGGAPTPAPHPSAPAGALAAATGLEAEALADARREAILELVEDGDFEGARALLGGLLVESYLAQARAFLAADSPADALIPTDRILEMDPRNLEGRLLKAEGSMRLAERGIASGGSASLIEGSLQDALEYYRLAANQDAGAVFGACRAAHLLGDTGEALRWARRGQELLTAASIREGELEPLPQRTVAEALFAAYTNARVEQAAAEDATELYFETEEALASLLGRAVDDPWVWTHLSDLYEWEERFDLALQKIDTGLLRLPDDPGLLERLARVKRKESGPGGVIAAFDGYVAKNPAVSLGHWYLGMELFEDGLERLDEGDTAAFRRAESAFKTTRELDPSMTSNAMGYEVMCRNALGWCAFNADDLEEAQHLFLSMNEIFERGIEWKIEGRLTSGIMGLAFIGDQYNNREEWLSAGTVFERAHELQPEESLWANNAGFFLRDAAVELEAEGARLCRAARGELTDEAALVELRDLTGIDATLSDTDQEKILFARAANRRMTDARAIMFRSLHAYQAAAELAPEDVRIVNDTALVLVYYLGTELERAQEYLRRCIDMGARQVAELEEQLGGELTVEERDGLEAALWDLENAWGDAHQNLGVLEFLHGEDLEAAARHCERSVEIGPDPRPDLTNSLLPLIRGEREPAAIEFFPIDGWALPCEVR